MTDRQDHISFEQLVDFQEERLPSSERGPVADHLAGCRQCADELSEVGRLIAVMRSDELEAPPAYAVAAARRVFLERPEPRPSAVRRLIAALSVDISGLTPAYGFRSAQPGERTMLFSADEYDVQVTAHPADGSWSIEGQVLGSDHGGEVVLGGAGGEVSATLTDLCEFSLPRVAAGSYTLAVRLRDVEIVLPELVLE